MQGQSHNKIIGKSAAILVSVTIAITNLSTAAARAQTNSAGTAAKASAARGSATTDPAHTTNTANEEGSAATSTNDGQPGLKLRPALQTPIVLPSPDLKALVSVDDQLDPYALDSTKSQPMSLHDVLKIAIVDNLDIGIARTREESSRWKYISSLGKFLPDLNTGYTLYGIAGKINLPFGNSSQTSASVPVAGAAAAGALATGTSTTQDDNVPSKFQVATAGFTYNGYQGGRIVFGALENLHKLRAQKASTRSTFSDTLMESTRDYYELLLNEALLQVRVKAVETSNEQIRINTKLADNGLATNLDILQAQTQLSRDRQDLVDQQIARRSAAIKLATTLNMTLADDISPTDRTVKKIRLIANPMQIQRLLQLAAQNRPEISQSEELRLAARKAVGVAAAPLQPSVKLQGNVYGLGTELKNMTGLYTLALSANWKVSGFGVTDAGETQAARWQARQRTLEQNKVLLNIFSEVRNSFLTSLRTERNIAETQNEVASAQEELRLAKIRFEQGLGANIDVVTAQRDLTSALVNHAKAVATFNIAQAQLLHDIGLISIDNLTASKPLTWQ